MAVSDVSDVGDVSALSHQHIWVNYNISLTWIKAIWGWFPLLTMILVRSQWGRYNFPFWSWQKGHGLTSETAPQHCLLGGVWRLSYHYNWGPNWIRSIGLSLQVLICFIFRRVDMVLVFQSPRRSVCNRLKLDHPLSSQHQASLLWLVLGYYASMASKYRKPNLGKGKSAFERSHWCISKLPEQTGI